MLRTARLGSLVTQLARLAAVGGAALALVASSESGERGDGRCPAGESCAPGTPDGLLFEGAPLGIWPALTAHTIAAGGRQTFRLTYPDTAAPFDLPFTAAVTAPGHTIVAEGADRAVVAAASAGSGYLRIVDAGGLLYDRLAIESAEVATVRAAPTFTAAYPAIDPPRWSAFAGGQVGVALVLADAGGTTVVDEGLALRSPVPSQRTSWDSFTLAPASAGTLALRVDAGHLADQEVRVPVTDTFDELAPPAPQETGVGGDLVVCFPAWERGAPGDGDDTLVVGVPRQYRVSGPAHPLAVQRYASCLEIHTDADGAVAVDATVGARTWTASITVRGSGKPAPASPGGWFAAAAEGERAILAQE